MLRIRNASISYVRPRALSFAIVISVLELIAKVTPYVYLATCVYSGVTERTIGKRVFISLSLSFHFLINCCISRFPRASVIQYVFMLSNGYFSFSLKCRLD